MISIRVALVELTVRFPRLALFRSSVRVLTLGLLMAMSSFTVMLLSVLHGGGDCVGLFLRRLINPAAVPELAEADVPPPPPPPPPPRALPHRFPTAGPAAESPLPPLRVASDPGTKQPFSSPLHQAVGAAKSSTASTA